MDWKGKSFVIEDAGNPTRGCVMKPRIITPFSFFASLSPCHFVLIGFPRFDQ